MTAPNAKLKSCLFWMLGALLLIASLDAIPDPPAIDQHSVKVLVSQISNASCTPIEPLLNCVPPCTVFQPLQAHRTAFTSLSEPNLPFDTVILTGQAADPSPPSIQSSQELQS